MKNSLALDLEAKTLKLIFPFCINIHPWREIVPGRWRGVIQNSVWTLSQDDAGVTYQTHNAPEPSQCKRGESRPRAKKLKIEGATFDDSLNGQSNEINETEHEKILRDYFQLNVCLEEMYRQWSKADNNFAAVCSSFPGVRMLNQDPVENVFSFICSSNNNIKRITMLVEKLCTLYGHPLAEVDGTMWHAFPNVSSLAAPGVEATLRDNGFGYRARYIQKSAEMILAKGGEAWLHSLKKLPYPECHAELSSLCGVGAKVADCICLMSMGHLEAIPVDTHVFQIAARDYLPHLRSCKTVTDRVYKEIGDHFRKVFGEYAGWAHSAGPHASFCTTICLCSLKTE
ncbi:N-glycosylase/DNA lyase-like isoform X2 [Macrobrachium nipponense]|uniref:N-glycosylase/DNA lyase-like isoform X2 n=1 Tax=Macrobrachium nipponense TaxID=159736 RepID=UPI0030C819B7